MEHKLFSNGEIVYLDGEYVGDCCDTIDEIVQKVLYILNIDYIEVDNLSE